MAKERYDDPNPYIMQVAYLSNRKKLVIEEKARALVYDRLTKRPMWQFTIRLRFNGKKASFTRYNKNEHLTERQKLEAFQDILASSLIFGKSGGNVANLSKIMNVDEKYAKKIMEEFHKTTIKLVELFGVENIEGIYKEITARLNS